jgi:hypothetical protein
MSFTSTNTDSNCVLFTPPLADAVQGCPPPRGSGCRYRATGQPWTGQRC